MPGQRLLIVDNDRAFLKEHQVSLESTFDVEVVASPDSAMQRLESGAFACVLICVEIADNRGYALCASIRRSAKLATIKVGLISAKATADEYKRHQGLKGRADLYLMKPVSTMALVEALRPLVPPRSVDPDNPLGDLADDGDLSGDLGGDWLGELKTDLGTGLDLPPAPKPAAPAASTVALSPAQIQAALAAPPPMPASARSTAPPHTLKPDMSEAKIAHLQEELSAKDRKLRETEEALTQLQRQLNSVTVNLDDLERRSREADQLRLKLDEAQTALAKAEESGDVASLRQQLKDAISERSALIHQADQLNQQLSEKTSRTIELLRERDKLQTLALEAPGLQDQLQAAEEKAAKAAASLKEAEETKASLAKDIEQALRETASLRQELSELRSTHEQERKELMGGLDAKEAELSRHKEQLRAALDTAAGHEKDKQGLQGQLADRGDRLKALSALMEELAEKLRHGSGLAKG